MESSEQKPKRRPRVSLLNLLLMTAVVALALTVWRERLATGVYRREIAELRRELGEVAVPNPKRLYVERWGGGYPNRVFRWRAYVPPGGHAYACLALKRQNRRSQGCIGLSPGQSTFEVVVVPNSNGEAWSYDIRRVRAKGGSSSGSGVKPEPPWIADIAKRKRLKLTEYQAGGAGPGERLELLRYADDPAEPDWMTLTVTIELNGAVPGPKQSEPVTTSPPVR